MNASDTIITDDRSDSNHSGSSTSDHVSDCSLAMSERTFSTCTTSSSNDSGSATDPFVESDFTQDLSFIVPHRDIFYEDNEYVLLKNCNLSPELFYIVVIDASVRNRMINFFKMIDEMSDYFDDSLPIPTDNTISLSPGSYVGVKLKDKVHFLFSL